MYLISRFYDGFSVACVVQIWTEIFKINHNPSREICLYHKTFVCTETLEKAARIHPDMLLKEVDAVRHKHRSTIYCDRLTQYIHGLPKPQ